MAPAGHREARPPAGDSGCLLCSAGPRTRRPPREDTLSLWMSAQGWLQRAVRILRSHPWASGTGGSRTHGTGQGGFCDPACLYLRPLQVHASRPSSPGPNGQHDLPTDRSSGLLGDAHMPPSQAADQLRAARGGLDQATSPDTAYQRFPDTPTPRGPPGCQGGNGEGTRQHPETQ